MKNIFYFLLCTAMMLSCSDDDEKTPAKEIEVDNPEVEINSPELSASTTATFTATTDWSISLDDVKATPSWFEVKPMSGGAGDVTLTITITEEATTDGDRTGYIKIKAGSSTVTITVNQRQKDALLVKDIDRVKLVNAESGTFTVALSRNMDYDIAIDGTSWLSLAETPRAMTDETVTFTVTENATDTQREGLITFMSKTEPVYAIDAVEVTQSAKYCNAADVNYRATTATDRLRVMDFMYTRTYALPSETGSTRIAWKPVYDRTFGASSSIIYNTWADCADAVTAARLMGEYAGLEEGLSEEYRRKKESSAKCVQAIFYYEQILLWGNAFVDMDGDGIIESLALNETYALLANWLEEAVATLPNPPLTSAETEGGILDRYVAMATLARVYAYKGEYQQALYRLQDIINSGYYSLEASSADILKWGSKEIIYALPPINEHECYYPNIVTTDLMSVISYSEILSLSVECANKLGNQTQAQLEYLNVMLLRAGLNTVNLGGGDNLVTALHNLWKTDLKATGAYFPFLKRNGLAESTLGISSHQTVLPIPTQVLELSNGSIAQNPGW